MQNQKAVTPYFTSKQLLSSGSVLQSRPAVLRGVPLGQIARDTPIITSQCHSQRRHSTSLISLWKSPSHGPCMMQRQTAVTAYFSINQLLLFAFAGLSTCCTITVCAAGMSYLNIVGSYIKSYYIQHIHVRDAERIHLPFESQSAVFLNPYNAEICFS